MIDCRHANSASHDARLASIERVVLSFSTRNPFFRLTRYIAYSSIAISS